MFEISWKTRVAQHIYERNLITLQTSGHFWKPLYDAQVQGSILHTFEHNLQHLTVCLQH